MRFPVDERWFRSAAACGVAWTMIGLMAGAEVLAPERMPWPATVGQVGRLSDLAEAARGRSEVGYHIGLEGTVWWADRTQRRLVLADESGAALLEWDWMGPDVRVSDRVRVEGVATVARAGAAYRLGVVGPVVDNDGVHAVIEKSGSVYLRSGRSPFRLEWFNAAEHAALALEMEGPEMPRQPIPAAAFFRESSEPDAAPEATATGLEFRCYEGRWQRLPDLSRETAVRTGEVATLDPGVRSRDEQVAVQFRGLLEVNRAGVYTFHLRSDDGSRLFVGEPTLQLKRLGEGRLPEPLRMGPGQPWPEGDAGRWVMSEGAVALARQAAGGWELDVVSAAGRMRVVLAGVGEGLPGAWVGRRVRVTGYGQATRAADGQPVAGVLWVPDRDHVQVIESGPEPEPTPAGGPPVLQTASAVHQLRREEAQRGLPVRIRGVVTSVLPEDQAFTVQDGTRGLYVVDASARGTGPPRMGDFLEIEGATDPGLFAPMVRATRVTSLGAGVLPDPVRPTWDQLLNGSLDAQSVEIACVVTAVRPEGVTLLTPDGVLRAEVRLNSTDAACWAGCENARVRIRGCLFALWDYVTHQVKAGEIRVYAADILVDQAAPTDVFASPTRSVSELRQFDPHAGVFQRVRVSGQIVHGRSGEWFLMEAGQGLRVLPREPVSLVPGDQVEVVGFPDVWGAASPVLREAVVRGTGHTPLPPAPRVRVEDLAHGAHDATRVRVEGVLVAVRGTASNTILELQDGIRTFGAQGPNLELGRPSLVVGSRLGVTGVCASQGGGRRSGPELAGFELLVRGASDVDVLLRPPWWTLRRLLVILGALAGVLMGAMMWIRQLHRQVEQRTAELETQIRERQRVEHQRAMEEERARIAQDLHDELGSGITEVSMLAARARAAWAPGDKPVHYLDQVGDTARAMVTALDEIVWAMNPRHDSLGSLVSYFCLYADRFLGLAHVAWRLDGAAGAGDRVLDSRQRHQLFLAFKEALTNVVRHSGATEVRLSVQADDGAICLAIADNGCGLADGVDRPGCEGLAGMRRRIEALGGRFTLTSHPGQGTALEFRVPTR